ncbi:Phytanoyl-CoA dioxygenase family protein [Balamuthia mandrillaris]
MNYDQGSQQRPKQDGNILSSVMSVAEFWDLSDKERNAEANSLQTRSELEAKFQDMLILRREEVRSQRSVSEELPSIHSGPGASSPLHASKQTIDSLLCPSYWRCLCPQLSLESDPSDALLRLYPDGVARLPSSREEQLREEVVEEGYAILGSKELPWCCDMNDLALGVVQLKSFGWSPTFICMFDEVWLVVQQLSRVLRNALQLKLNMDFFCFYVDAFSGRGGSPGAGWPPHRDRPNSDPVTSFREDGTPKYCTVWIPFTPATPESSCLYVVPAHADPSYRQVRIGKDLLSSIFTSPATFQEIRALPCGPGDVVLFSHRLVHWGSRCKKTSEKLTKVRNTE